MYEIERTYHGETRKHYVLTRDEADERDIRYVRWDEVKEVGDYGISDDHYVAEVLGINGPYSSGRRQIVYPYARPWGSTKELVFLDHYDKGNFTASAPRSWAETESIRERGQRVIRMYAQILIMKGRATAQDYEILGRIYRPDEKKPAATVKRLLKQSVIQKMVSSEIVALLKDKGITPESVVDKYTETYNAALNEGHTGTMKSVTDQFAKMLGMDGGSRSSQGRLPPGGVPEDELHMFLADDAPDAVDHSEYLSENDYMEVE